jgi:hypothetical protein
MSLSRFNIIVFLQTWIQSYIGNKFYIIFFHDEFVEQLLPFGIWRYSFGHYFFGFENNYKLGDV